MVSFSVLNPLPKKDTGTSKEIQIESFLGIYANALKIQSQGNLDDAMEKYLEIVKSDLLSEELNGVGVHTSPLHTLQFVIFKNLAKIYHEKKNDQDALTYFIKAVQVDEEDYESWGKIGEIALKLKKLKTAIWAFSAGRDVSNNDFLFLEGLIKTTYEAGLFAECYILINQALKDNPLYRVGLALKDTILESHVSGLSMSSMLETCIQVSDVFAFQTRKQVIDCVPRDLVIYDQNLGKVTKKKIELSKASFLQLGNSLLKTYSEFLSDDNASFSTQISIVVEMDTEEFKMAQEKIENLQDSFDFNSDQELFLQEDAARKKRKGSSVTVETVRSSKRVRKSIEEELKMTPESMIKENLDPLLPQGWKLASGDNKNMSFLVQDLGEFFESLSSRISVNNSLSAQKARIKRKRTAQKLDEYVEIAEEVALDHTLSHFNSFLALVPDKTSLLNIMRMYLIFILSHETSLSSDMCDMVSLILKRIESHNCGVKTFQNMKQFKENDDQLLLVLLSLCEIVFDGISESDIEFIKWELDTENPLFSMNQISLFDRIFSQLISLIAFKSLKDLDSHDFNIRYLWLLAKDHERCGRISQSLEYYTQCKDLLSNKSVLLICGEILNLDAIISKVKNLNAQEYLINIEDLFRTASYDKVVGHLQSIFSSNGQGSSELIELAKKLIFGEFPRRLTFHRMHFDSLKTLNRDGEAVKNGIVAAADILRNILLYDGQIDVPLQFFCDLWGLLIDFLAGNNWTEQLNCLSSPEFDNKTFLELLVDECAICVKLSIYLFGLPRDYMASLPKTVYEKRIKTIEIFCVRSWMIFYLIIKQILAYENYADSLQINPSNSILEFLHQFLGDLKVCSVDGGRFLNFIIRELKNSETQRDAYQCYFCLYGIVVKFGDAEFEPKDHNTSPKPFELEAATEVFESAEHYVINKFKNRSFRSVSNEVRDCIDKVAQLFKKTPRDMVEVEINKNNINNYLKSDIDPLMLHPDRPNGLVGLVRLHSEKIPEVQLRLFKLQAMILWAQFKVQLRKEGDSLKMLITQLMNHLYLDPEDIDGWALLAQSYKSQAEELLNGSVQEVTKGRKNIANCQRRSFLCFVQAIKHLKKASQYKRHKLYVLGARRDVASTLWGDFGDLLRSIVSEPMDGRPTTSTVSDQTIILLKLAKIAKENEQNIITIKQQDSIKEAFVSEKVNINQRRQQILYLSVYAFTKAEMFDHREWYYPFALASCYAKLAKKSSEVINSFATCIELLPMNKEEKILEPIIKLLSFLRKALYRDQIQPLVVTSSISTIIKRCLLKLPVSGKSEDGVSLLEIPELSDEKHTAFSMISNYLEILKSLDKKKWYHKIYYQQAWIAFKVFKDSGKAQEILSNLFQFKPTSKTFIQFWKSPLQRPGRHYIYTCKYVDLMISIILDFGDVETLKSLARKLSKSEEIFYFDKSWKYCFESLLHLLSSTIPHSQGLSALTYRVSKSEFLQIAPGIEAIFFNSTDSLKNLLVGTLLSLFELKKLNDSRVGEVELDRLLVESYTSLFVGSMTSTVCENPSLDFSTVLKRALTACRGNMSGKRLNLFI